MTPSTVQEEELIKANVQLVRSCIRPYFLQGGDFDDLYQEGMLGLLSAVRSYDPSRNDSFQAYAALCIKRRVIDAVRRDRTRQAHVELEEAPVESRLGLYSTGHTADPEASILASETAKEIKRTLSGMLSPFEVSVLDRYLEGYTASEIADQLRRNRKSVDNAIRRVRQKLAEYLSASSDNGNHPFA
ncbi:MAG: sigma-70 family RNA polymerase sigma factor [Clostridia bacterium]|nr:sigma-70 family RNA polymerase sigma factor [Clostridia bacterium]